MKISKKRIFDIIQIGNKEDVASTTFDRLIVVMIAINLFVTLFSTYEASNSFSSAIYITELVTSVFFLIEYALRVWTSDHLFPEYTKAKALLRFVFSIYGMIDLLAFLPFFLPFFFPYGVVAFRLLRVIRIFRLFKINAQYDAFNVIINVFKEKKDQLLSSICLILIFMVASSLCIYSVEHDVQPDKFTNAFSGLWWATSTLMTVGYGDVYPITTLGKILSIVITFLGVGLVAIPTGIISAGFIEQYRIFGCNGAIDDSRLNFITPTITEDHPWNGMAIRDMVLPPEMQLINVFRKGNELNFKQGTRLKVGDELVIYLRDVKRTPSR